MKEKSHLLLKEQLCFPIYATSRMVTRLYQPWLDKLGLTYPQYLVMLVLWEEQKLTVSQLCKRLYLNTNTVTPLLKKLRDKGLVAKERSTEDERTVYIELTQKGDELQALAEEIPANLVEAIDMPLEELKQMRELMWKFLSKFD
ncbi:MarR family transcriptional regulator [Fulvivirga ulvae]|uniref:MarR family winged helix-turn-helix transcriptional regulator n=1 Tax=Fulvivirga ulvae TaxID=2904245 RepID=UPI001F17BB53|nr:MarR family transcriptional regulator [Fulvivirga ulvae]UII29701.1 MarR family transcriptional regulator [Fulvivirga ulvae]